MSYDLYGACWRKCLLPMHNRLRGRHAVARYNALARSQWWSRDRLIDFQWHELQALLNIALTKVPYYRRVLKGVDYRDFRDWHDFRKLPLLTRGTIQEYREDLRAEGLAPNDFHVHATGGSSGQPTSFYRTTESYDWRLAATRRTYSWTGYEYGDRMLFLWGAPVGSPRLSQLLKQGIMDSLNRYCAFPTFTHSEALWRSVYKKMSDWRPKYLGGYVSSLVAFAQFVDSTGLRLPYVKAVITGAEPLGGNKRAYLSSIYNAPVFETYGSREFMSIAGECDRHQGLHVVAENVLLEMSADDPSTPSDLLVTDLHNHGTVFLRYSIGDCGVLSDRICGCGRGLPMLEQISGRTTHVLKLSDGRALTSLFFFHLLKEFAEIVEFQVIQPRPDHLVISAIVSAPLPQQSILFLDAEMRKALQGDTYEFRPVRSLERGPSGKVTTIVPFTQSRSSDVSVDIV